MTSKASKKKIQAKSSVRANSKSQWKPLKRGDVVDVVAPGFRPTDDEVEAGIEFLESWGLKPRLPKDIFSGLGEASDILSSNFDEKRFQNLAHALAAKDSAAVWCLRGGYGSIRLVPSLMKLKRPARVKPLIGISDVTTLQLFLDQKWKWPSLHGPLLDRLGRTVNEKLREKAIREGKFIPPQAHVEELRRVLEGELSTVLFEGLRWIGHQPGEKPRARNIDGVTTGGNLVTFASSIGTALHPSTAGKIVFFEDIGERGYRVDRLLEQLVQSRVLTAKTKAVVFGEFIEGREPDGTSKVSSVIERFAKTWGSANGVPILTGLPMGHGENQRVVPFGTSAHLDWLAGSLEVATGAGVLRSTR